MNRADGISEIEGKAARAAASEEGRERVSNSCLKSFSKKNLDSDDHFERPFSFMTVKGNYRIRKEMDKTLGEKTARASRFP